jgi:trigger factor
MQVKVSESSLFERTLEVTVKADLVEGAYNRAFGRACKRLALPGFRRGKVPAPMARKYITDEGLASDVVDEVVPKAYVEALRENKLQPISQPRWELLQRERGKDLIFKVSFEVKPDVEIVDYKGVQLKNERQEIGQAEVDKALDDIRQGQSSLVDIEQPRPLAEDDLALVDYRSTLAGNAVDGGAASNYLMEVKREHFIPGFVDQLVGLEMGQEKEFDITFPAEYPNTELAGKEVHFYFKLHQIKERKLPEVTDEFAKAVSPFQTAEELIKEVKERLEANEERRVREQVAIKIIDRLLSQVSNEIVPRSLHQYRTQVELRRRVQQLEQMGLSVERLLSDRGVTQEQWINEIAVVGRLEARVEILLDSLARRENLHPTEEEIEELYRVEAANRGISVPQLRQQLDQDGSEGLVRYALLRAKVMDFLYDNAQVEFVPPGTVIEEPAAPATEEEKPKAKKAKAATEEAAAEKPKAKKAKAAADEAVNEEAAPAEEKPKAKKAKAVPPEPAAEEAPAKPKRTTKKKDTEA